MFSISVLSFQDSNNEKEIGLNGTWHYARRSKPEIGFTMKIDGEDVGTISNYWPNGLTCDQPLALNVSRSAGSYTLTAESNLGYYWEGTITFVQGTCDMVELTLGKKGISTSQGIPLAPRSSAGNRQK